MKEGESGGTGVFAHWVPTWVGVAFFAGFLGHAIGLCWALRKDMNDYSDELARLELRVKQLEDRP